MSEIFEALKMFLDALVTLGAAFAGAYFAFRFEKSQRDKERTANDVAAGNRALFTLVRIWNGLKQYQIKVVDRYRSKNDAWLNLSVAASLINDSISFEEKDLSFVLQSDPATFQLVFLESDRAQTAHQMINQRNALVLSKVWPTLTAAGFKIADQRPEQEIKDILGVGIVQQLTTLTAGIIKNVDEDVISSREAFDKLRSALKVAYPKEKFILFPKEQQLADTSGSSK